MKFVRGITYCLLLVVLSSGMPSEKATRKFTTWYSENASSLMLSEIEDDYTCTIRYIPTELNVLRAVSSETEVKRSEIKELYEKYEGSYEFTFKVRKKSVSDLLTHVSGGQEDYTNRQFYLLESIGQDFTLVTKQGELKPLDCHFENNYGAAPFLTFHLVFDRAEDNELQHFIYQDQFFGLGSLIYDLNTIENLTIPKIK